MISVTSCDQCEIHNPAHSAGLAPTRLARFHPRLSSTGIDTPGMQEASSDTRGPVRGQLGGPCLCWGCTIEWRFKIMEAVADPADPPAAAAAADLLLLAGQKTRDTTVAEATGSASEPEWGCVASPPPVKIELAEAADGLMRTGTAMVQHAFGTVHYEGRLDGAGKASGKGEGTWLDGAWKGVVYEGQWTENLPLGWGNWKILAQATCTSTTAGRLDA